MVKLNISCYIWSSLNSVVWIMAKRLLHSLLEEYESFSSHLLWVPPSVSNGGSALCPDDFWNFSPYAFWLCTYIPRVVYFKKCHFLFSYVEWTNYVCNVSITPQGSKLRYICYKISHLVTLVLSNSVAPNDCFLLNICSEKQILPRLFYSLRAVKHPSDYRKYSFSHFTLQVRLFFVEERKPKIFGIKNVIEKGITEKNSLFRKSLNCI